MMNFNYSKLRGKIREVFKTEASFAKKMGISTTSLSQKLNNKVEFTQAEIERAVELLNIPKEEIPMYFFTVENKINARMGVSNE
jgi:transcriptional regulator with XRE-family HTH domain